MQEAFQRAPRPPVRLLHARHGHGGGRRCSRRTRTRPRPRCARASRATSAAAPATRTSSRRCWRAPRSNAARRCRHDRHRGPAATTAGDRHPHACAGRTRRCSPARPASPTTSTSRARCTWRSCAARTPTPASPRSTCRAALALPGVVAVYTGADLADALGQPDAVRLAGHRGHEEPAALPAGDRQGLLRRRRRGRGARRAPTTEARDALEAIVVDYDPLPAVVDLEDALSRPGLVHDDLGTNASYTWELHLDDDAVERGLRRRRPRREGALRPAAAHPDGDGAPGLRGGARSPSAATSRSTRATQIPHILKVMAAITLGLPEHQLRVVAPSVGGGFGSKLNVYAEELLVLALAHKLTAAGALGRGAHRERAGHHPRPRPDPGHRAGRRRRRQAHGGPGRPARRHGRLPPAGHPGHPAARRLPLRRRLRRARLLVLAAPASSPP